jgi:hypothetical protein
MTQVGRSLFRFSRTSRHVIVTKTMDASAIGTIHIRHAGARMTMRATVGTCAAAILAVVSLLANAVGQQRSSAEQLIGTWTLVSHEAVRKDGSKFFPYGPSPKGVAIFDSSRFIITVMRSDRPKYAIELPSKGTAEENKATAEGTMTYFGTYSVNEADRVIAIHIEASSFPNWSGTDQVREFAISRDQLTLTARALATGGHADVLWKRSQ